jgi:hypothetical protein
MVLPENVMEEVFESEKNVIEELTNRISFLEEQLDESNKYKYLYQELIIKFNSINEENKHLRNKLEKYEKMEKRSGVVDLKNSEEYLKIVKEKDKYKNDYYNLNTRIQELENSNKIENNIDESFINNKINEALDSQKIVFNKLLQGKENEYKTLYDNFNKLNQDFLNLKNNKGIPSPTSSTENKKNIEIIKLPHNLFEVIYYRHINNNKYLPGYHTTNGVAYLECCGKQWDYKELNSEGVTCKRCFKTYKINNNRLTNEILPEYIINNENYLLSKIKCNKCDYISKKEINLCYNCKNLKNVKIIEYPMPQENDRAKETKLALAGKCYNNIIYINSIFLKAHKEGLVKNGWKPLIDYIKDNKLMEEKQINIIKNKIIRCNDITFIYNLDKYKNIQGFIKRLSFSLNSLSKLPDDDYQSFKYDLTEKLDNYLDKIKNKENIIAEEDINKINININQYDNNKEKCIKCIKELKNNEFIYCIKCEKLCQVDDCKNKKHILNEIEFDFCFKHFKESMPNLDDF